MSTKVLAASFALPVGLCVVWQCRWWKNDDQEEDGHRRGKLGEGRVGDQSSRVSSLGWGMLSQELRRGQWESLCAVEERTYEPGMIDPRNRFQAHEQG